MTTYLPCCNAKSTPYTPNALAELCITRTCTVCGQRWELTIPAGDNAPSKLERVSGTRGMRAAAQRRGET